MRTLSISCGCWWGYIIRETTSDVPRSQFVLRWRNKTHKQDFRRAFRGQPTNSGPATCWPYQNQGMLLLMNLMESSCKSKKKCHHPQLCARKNRISISPAPQLLSKKKRFSISRPKWQCSKQGHHDNQGLWPAHQASGLGQLGLRERFNSWDGNIRKLPSSHASPFHLVCCVEVVV